MDIFNHVKKIPLPADKNLANIKLDQLREAIEKNPDPNLKNRLNNFLENDDCVKILEAIFGNSNFLSTLGLRNHDVLDSFFNARHDEYIEGIFSSIKSSVSQNLSKQELKSLLRKSRNKISLMVALLDITEVWLVEQITGKLSEFAEVSTNATLSWLLTAAEREGVLKNSANSSGIILLALGKLGAGELNYSSDIDVIFFYEPEKVNYIGDRGIQKFMNRLVQDFTEILEERTEEGFVFRVDLRLRPDPASTPAAITVRAAEIYYESVGQNWERAAYIKARPIAGDIELGNKFIEYLRPYVWRKNLDFAAIEDIQSIKRQIDNKNKNTSENLYGYNIKLGHGGIREIEFFAQTQQLIWGGKEPQLRVKPTCIALDRLTETGKVERDVSEKFKESYRFYRKIEHRLQMMNDHQTHDLPENAESLQNFSLFLGFNNGEEFVTELKSHISEVQRYYGELYNTSPSLGASGAMEASGSLVFTGTENDEETLETIKNLGFNNPINISEAIRGWHHGRRNVTRSKRARELITELTPAILSAFSKTVNPDTTFARFDEFLARLPDGVQIFSLFYSNPHLLEIIAEIMGKFEYLADKLARKPALLEYVLSPEFYLDIPEKESLRDKLEINIEQAKDLQDILDITRRWTHDRQFRAGVQLLKGKITAVEASTHLSNIADTVLGVLFNEVKKDFASRHGYIADSDFGVIAMGKLGGRELTFNSDLDLVFVYDVKDKEAFSDGPSSLSASEYFLRLSRRFITAISSMTSEGKLYEIDNRLRPSGSDGPLAASIEALDIYYEKSAWIWEFMALTKARIIFGSMNIQTKLRKIINEKIMKKRAKAELAKSILEMREKIQLEFATKNYLDIKYVRGGLIDLEFIIQYLQLLNSHDNPEIIESNTLSALKRLNLAGFIKNQDFTDIYKAAELLITSQSYLRLISNVTTTEEAMTKGTKKALSSLIYPEDADGSKFEEFKNFLVENQKKVHKYFDQILTP